jgi:hypothetical protein
MDGDFTGFSIALDFRDIYSTGEADLIAGILTLTLALDNKNSECMFLSLSIME